MRSPVQLVVVTLFAVACASAPDTRPFQNPSHEPRRFSGGGEPLTYVVIGDSTAAGQGAAYDDGIAVGTARDLAKARAVSLINLGISGARMADVVRDQLGEAERAKPDVVLVAAGANDVTHLTPIGSMERNVRTIVAGLRAANPNVKIVVTGSPDMSTPPRIPRLLRGVAGWRTRAVNRMFERVAAESQLAFAPIAKQTGPLFARDRTLFDTDDFHPNARGYATWIDVINGATRTLALR
jgi:lysophospholipase L1-like esterase